MKFVITFILFSTAPAFAIGPFGAGVTLGKISGIDNNKCSAGHILKKVHFETGINLADGNAPRIWKCDDPALRLKCPLSQSTDLNGKDFSCYRETAEGPYACVGAPSSDLVKGKAQPRFQELFIFNIDANGYKKQSSYKMDASGCQPLKVEVQDNIGQTGNGNFTMTFESCAKEVKNAMQGKSMYPSSRNEETRKIKFCEDGKITPNRVKAYHSRMKRTMRCFEMFPAFKSRFNDYLSAGKSSKRGSREKVGSQ